MTTSPDLTTQVYQAFIKAAPQRVWQAITEPDLTMRFFHGARITNTPERHVSFGPDGSTWGDGAVLEWDPPRRLVHEWRSLYDPELAAKNPAASAGKSSRRTAACALSPSHTTTSKAHPAPRRASPAPAGRSYSAA